MTPSGVTRVDFTQMLAACRPAMRRFALVLVGGDDVDDVVQDAAERAWIKRQLFDPSRGSAQAWLLAIVADQVRSRRRRPQPVWDELPNNVLITDDMDPAAIDIGRGVERLPPRQRAAVVLYYYLDLPVADVAHLMGCTAGTVKSTLYDARATLEQILGDFYANQ